MECRTSGTQPIVQYGMIKLDDALYDISSLFFIAACRVQTSAVISSNTTITVASLVDTGPGLISVIKDFLPPRCKESLKTIKLPPLHTLNGKVESVEVIVLLFVHICYLRVRPCIGVVQNFAVDVVLRMSFIDRCIRKIFPSK